MSHFLRSTRLGDLEWDPSSELFFPQGLPGFEAETRLIPVEIPAQRPLVYLQSATRSDLCFLALPAASIDPDFATDPRCEEVMAVSDDRTGGDLLCLALLVPSAGGVRTNLAAPVVIGLSTMRGVQLTPGSGPRHWHLRESGAWEGPCS